MNNRYIFATIIAISILVLNQIFIQYFLHEKKYDAKTINLAGKQRMLSQKINLELYKIINDQKPSTQLFELFDEWKNTHFLLLENTGNQELSPIEDPNAIQLMSNLSSNVLFLEGQLTKLSTHQTVDLETINSNQAVFLEDMNNVVKFLEDASSKKLRFIVLIEILLMLFSILIIILEILFIFRPSHQRLEISLDETRKSKEALEKTVLELKRKNSDLEQFAYVASHDLQEPLRTITSFTQLLQRKYKNQIEQDGKEEMTFIINAAFRMKTLINGLLDYARIGKVKQIKSIDCNVLVDKIRQDLDTIIKEKNASVHVDSLPSIQAYPVEVRQLFQNLITNALKFQKVEENPSIIITGTEMEGKYQFSVKDNGIGISEQYQEQIFMIFKRLHRADQYEGTGIGLAQCKKIVEMHKGEIWVTSTVNEGSTFYFTIPYSLS